MKRIFVAKSRASECLHRLIFMVLLAATLPSAAYGEGESAPHRKLITPMQATILGVVEGLTEYLPVSSTGHLVLADEFLGLRDQSKYSEDEYSAIEAYEIVIQGGAILAVLLLYMKYVLAMIQGLVGRNPAGRKLLINVVSAFMPAAVVGLLLHKIIKTYLQSTIPVVAALAVGGIVMILFERSSMAKARRQSGFGLHLLSVKHAVIIGFAQCVSMWPGTSRSMMTILAGMAVGMNPVAAAEFSFLLGLPTLLAATAFKIKKEGHLLAAHIDLTSMVLGGVVAAVTAAFAVKALIGWLNRHGLTPFGWYRIALAIVVLWVIRN